MKIVFKDNTIRFSRMLSIVDKFTFDFVALLEKAGIKYVIVSGYAALLFGRARITEDIDILFDRTDMDKITKLYELVLEDYWFLNAHSLKTVMALLNENSSIRIAKKGTISPNIELKPAKNELDNYSLINATSVIINRKYKIEISPLELQIPYKLYLGAKKDIEDARFLYDIFKEKIDKNKLLHFCRKLGVTDKVRYLGD